MIRVISVLSLTLLLIFVLYLPSAHPPERFLAQMHTEHARNTQFWGNDRAAKILARTLAMNAALSAVSPVPSSTQAPRPHQVGEAVGQEMERVNRRFFGNSYFRAIDALLLLATYRCVCLLEWLPALAFALLAIVLDGGFVRVIRSKEFKRHDPEWFALHACGFILAGCVAIIACVTPVTISPLALAALPLAGGVFLSRMVANFHRRN
jgi:hypothetical protein